MTREISYKLEAFEGPLDLLLHLIDREKIDIYDIPIAQITAQYLEYVSGMEVKDLDVMSDFMVMAATLLDIKARMLLPKEVTEEGEEIDPRADLVERLIEHRKYRMMAQELAGLEADAARQLFREPSIPREVAKYEPPVDLDSLLDGVTLARLQDVFDQVMKRRADRVDPVRSRFGTIRRERVSLKSRILSLVQFTREHRNFSFRDLLERERSKEDIIVTFLAVLELTKIGRLQIAQDGIDQELRIETVELPEGAELDLAALEDLEA